MNPQVRAVLGRPGQAGPGEDAVFVLFPDCPVSGCRNVVNDLDEVCRQCLDAFGPYLRSAAPVAPSAGQQTTTSAAPAGQAVMVRREQAPAAAVEWTRNQVCWCCEARHTCRQDPDSSNGWICKQCLEIQ